MDIKKSQIFLFKKALALVAEGNVYNYFCLLMSTLEPTAELQGCKEFIFFKSYFIELIMYFVNTYLGPQYILENEIPFVDLNGENYGEAADGWIRNEIINRNLQHRNALYSINLWNMVNRLDQGLCRTNNSVEGEPVCRI